MLPAGRQAPQELDGTPEAPTCPSARLGPELRGASVPRRRPCSLRWAAPPPRSNEDFQAEGPGRILEAPVLLGEGPVVPGHGAGPARPTENGQGRGCSTLPGALLSLLCPHPPRMLRQLQPSPEGHRCIGEECPRDVREAWSRAAQRGRPGAEQAAPAGRCPEPCRQAPRQATPGQGRAGLGGSVRASARVPPAPAGQSRPGPDSTDLPPGTLWEPAGQGHH